MPAAPGPPPPAALSLPAFGFGCASLMAKAGRGESLAMPLAARDSGYTRFDVALMYGCVGADLSAPGVLASLALMAAAARNPEGTVLVASREPGGSRSNARVLSGERRVDADVSAFKELARAAAPGPAG